MLEFIGICKRFCLCSLLVCLFNVCIFLFPSLGYVTDSSQCENSVLSTYNGSANLTANWQGNTINVTWYNGDTEYDSNQCTYGGDLTMPSSIPQKTGYTFKGWRVKPAPLCGLTANMMSSDGTGRGYLSHDGNKRSHDVSYGLTTPGDWVVDFSYGSYRGNSSCNNLAPSVWDTVLTGLINETMSDEDAFVTLWGNRNGDSYQSSLSSSSTGVYCWCHAQSYTPNNGTLCDLSSLPWVFNGDNDDEEECATECAGTCGSDIEYMPAFRTAVFGVQ